jgi:glutamate carboxypeptidase
MLAKQPFRIDGNRAYRLGIADDKHGIALILHTLAMLREMNFRDYGLIMVLINADEEVSSPGSAASTMWYSRVRALVSSRISCR